MSNKVKDIQKYNTIWGNVSADIKRETCVFKSIGNLLFSLFSCFCNSETCVFKSSGRLLFLLYSVNFVIQKLVRSNQVGGCFLVY